MSDIIAERVLEFREGEASRQVTVRVFRPEPVDEGGARIWTCMIEWEGLDIPPQRALGTDSAEALFNALGSAGTEVKRHEELRVPRDDYPEGQKRNPWPIESGPPSLPVAAPLPGDVILERMLSAPGSDELNARVTVHRPQPKGATDWICHYEIDAPTQPKLSKQHWAHGTDSAQALFLALVRIKWDIESRGFTHPHVQNPWEISVEFEEPPKS